MNDLRLDPIFSDRLVLQREAVNRICGYAPAGSEVTVSLAGKKYTASADESGRFRVPLPELPACAEPQTLTVYCGDDSATLSDVLVGDVFHITGQSNMELPIRRTFDPFSDTFRTPDSPMIREFRTPIISCFDKEGELEAFSSGCWTRSDSPEAMGMSAAGYFFAKTLYEDIKIPIGLVNTAAGGSAIEGRLPYSVLSEYPEYDEFLAIATQEGYIENTSRTDAARDGGHAAALEQGDRLREKILAGESPEGEKVSFPVTVRDFSGRLWFYNDFDLPEDFPSTGAMLLLGTMTDRDVAYVNGVQAGETGYMYPPRFYHIPDGLLKPGKNRVSFLLDIRYGEGGITEGKRWCIKAGEHILDLTCGWTMCTAVTTEKIIPAAFFQGLPLALFSKSTAPAFHLPFKGMLIYQGESNGYNAPRYEQMFTRFVEYYRQRCGYDIPIVTTQLPEFGLISDDSWAVLRQAQLDCCRIPGTAMAVTLGLGEPNDLHPINKWEVGRRLALCAKALIYDKRDYEPVRCVSAEYSEGSAKLTFSKPVTLNLTDESYFEAVYGDKPVTVKVSDDLTVQLPGGKPDRLRYAWRSSPDKPQLFDEKGLPVSPFEIKVI